MESKRTIPSWELMAALRRKVGMLAFNQALGVGERQGRRYCANPDCTEQPERNPLDRLAALLAEAGEQGADAEIDAVLAALARPVGRCVEPGAQAPDGMTLGEALGELMRAVGMIDAGVGLYPQYMHGALAQVVRTARQFGAVYERDWDVAGPAVRLSAGDLVDAEAERLAEIGRTGTKKHASFLRRLFRLS